MVAIVSPRRTGEGARYLREWLIETIQSVIPLGNIAEAGRGSHIRRMVVKPGEGIQTEIGCPIDVQIRNSLVKEMAILEDAFSRIVCLIDLR